MHVLDVAKDGGQEVIPARPASCAGLPPPFSNLKFAPFVHAVLVLACLKRYWYIVPHKRTQLSARAWVLGSMLRSPFLLQHAKPEALLMWIVAEYAELQTLRGCQGT